MLKGRGKFLVEGNPPQSWPWKQNGTTIVAVAVVMILEVVNNWRSLFQINILKKKIEPESSSVTGKVSYHYNSWVTGVYMAYKFDRNSRGKTSQTEWLFESNVRSCDYFKCSIALWLPLGPSCKGNLYTRIGWVLKAEIVTWRPK